MSFEYRKENIFAVVTLDENRLDASQANAFRDYMLSLIDSGEHNIVLDLSHVSFMDSSGLGAVVAVRKQLMSDNENTMHLACPQPAVSDLLNLTCMDKVFSIYPSVNDAIQTG